jgi:hypothetical protein
MEMLMVKHLRDCFWSSSLDQLFALSGMKVKAAAKRAPSFEKRTVKSGHEPPFAKV